MRSCLVLAPLLLANQAAPAELPAPVKAMLDAALASGNEGEVATIVKYARAAAPEHADAIAKLASDWQAGRHAMAQRKLREADFLDLVKGRAELGGYVTSGNTEDVGVVAALDLRREAIEWRHKLALRAEYQESRGITSRERYVASYEPNWKFDARAYVYGAAQFERDRFAGFTERYSLSAGAGYSAIKSKALTLELELGPAYRNTSFTDFTRESNIGARGSVDLDWRLARGVTFRQDASAYLQDANSTVQSVTALNSRLFGPFSAQLSYTVQYESMPPAGRQSTDTTSRASLVVDF